MFFPLIAAVEQCSELKWQILLTLCLSKVGGVDALQAFETHCSVELRNSVPALQLQLNFRAYWMFPFSLVTAAPISSLMKVHRCSTVPGSVGTACVECGLHYREILCMHFCVCVCVCLCLFSFTKGHSHATCGATQQSQKLRGRYSGQMLQYCG